jgi:uncharacterized protein (TIGR03067 family)
MNRAKLWLLLAIAIAPTAVGHEVHDDDLKRMQGDWRVVSMNSGGMKVPDEDAQALFRTVEGDRYTVSRYSKQISQGVLKIDASKTPKTIDSTPAGPADKVQPILGIYEFDGDRLRISNAQPGKPRPTDFKPRFLHTVIEWEPEPK